MFMVTNSIPPQVSSVYRMSSVSKLYKLTAISDLRYTVNQSLIG